MRQFYTRQVRLAARAMILSMSAGVSLAIAFRKERGKSGLHKGRVAVNDGAERSAESGTENRPPERVRVKRRGKSPPARE